MTPAIRHDRQDESIEAKARWFQSLSMAERMEIFCSLVDLALSINPSLKNSKHVQPVPGRIQVLSSQESREEDEMKGHPV